MFKQLRRIVIGLLCTVVVMWLIVAVSHAPSLLYKGPAILFALWWFGFVAESVFNDYRAEMKSRREHPEAWRDR